MTCEAFYFKLEDGTLMGFDHNNKTSAQFSEAKKLGAEFFWEEIALKNVQSLVYLYTAFNIFSISKGNEDINYIAISHGKFISIYNLAINKWEQHIRFDADVIYMFSHEAYVEPPPK